MVTTKTSPNTVRPHIAVSLAVALLLVTGCALSAQQKAAVSQFSDSSATLGDVTASPAEGDAGRDGRDDEAAVAAGRAASNALNAANAEAQKAKANLDRVAANKLA